MTTDWLSHFCNSFSFIPSRICSVLAPFHSSQLKDTNVGAFRCSSDISDHVRFRKVREMEERSGRVFAFRIINDDRWKMATESSPDVEYHVRVYIILSYRSEQENGRKSRNERKNLLTFRYLRERR